MAALQAFLAGPDAHKRHLEMLRQVILGGGGGAVPTPGPEPGPGPEPEPEPEPETVEENDVTFYDWDGTVLYAYTAAEALLLDEMPEIPDRSSEELVDGAWNWTLEELKAQVRDVGFCCVGANYFTVGDYTIIECVPDIIKTVGFFCERLSADQTGYVVVDWGDGTTESGAGVTDGQWTHTYANSGQKYTIRVSGGQVVRLDNVAADRAFVRMKCGWRTYGNNTFKAYGYNLEAISLPPVAIPEMLSGLFGSYMKPMPVLRHVTLPRGTNLSNNPGQFYNVGWGVAGGVSISTPYGMSNPKSLSRYTLLRYYQSATLPTDARDLMIASGGKVLLQSASPATIPPKQAMYPPTKLRVKLTSQANLGGPVGYDGVTIGPSVTTLTMSETVHIENAIIIVPETVTKIQKFYSDSFESLFRARELHFLASTPPELAYPEASEIKTARIYVPAGAVETYKNATNYARFADWIFAETEA